MALITLIRHGQASFLEPNYDKLSERGARQSKKLGEYWVSAGARFDQIYYGPACRHRETGDIVGAVYREAGLEWPAVVTLATLDEYPGIQVMRTFLPEVMEAHEDVRALEAEFRQAAERAVAVRIYDKLFQRITRMWVDEQLHAPEVESWKNFCGRVARGISEIRERAGKNERIAVFTSGGVIAATAKLALDLGPQKTLELSWTSRNASYAEFLSSGDRFSLSSFNNHPHLLDEELLTYR
jgi:broad specificity phosphatase PhoE